MNDARVVAASAIALAVTLFAIFWMRPLARRLGLVDKPCDRKRHRGRVPLVGGLCFFLGTVVGLVYLGYVDRMVASLLAAGSLIVVTGAIDDVFDLSVRSRLLIQACAAVLVIAATGIYFNDAGGVFGGTNLYLGLLGIPITVVAVMGLMNAYNMLDGIDGLAATLAMVSIGAIMLFAHVGWPTLAIILLLQVLFAALVPYLLVNLGWPDGRKIFMGDAGSTLIGFLLAWSLVYLSHGSVSRLAPVDALWCIAIPILDTLAVMYRRMSKGISPFKADRQHLHHLLLDAGCSARTALVVIVAMASALAGIGYALRDLPELLSGLAFVSVLALYMFGFSRLMQVLRPHLARWSPPPVAVPAPRHNSGAGSGTPTTGGPVRTLCLMATHEDAMQVAPIARQLAGDARFDARICVATQSDQTPQQAMDLLDVRADAHVEIGEGHGAASGVSSAALGEMKRLIGEFKPDVVVVPGDDQASLAATLAAFYQQIPVVCIEPGSPANDPQVQQADDLNRRLSRSLTALHVAPTAWAGQHLIDEGVPADRIMMATSAAGDALRAAVARIGKDDVLRRQLERKFAFLPGDRPMVLVAGNADTCDGFDALVQALPAIARAHPEADVVCPSLRACDPVDESAYPAQRNLHVLPPLDYLSFAYLLDRAHLVLAASPSVAAEVATTAGAVVLARAAAPLTESMLPANVRVVGLDADDIAATACALLSDGGAHAALCGSSRGDEDGQDACLRVIEALAVGRRGKRWPFTDRRGAIRRLPSGVVERPLESSLTERAREAS